MRTSPIENLVVNGWWVLSWRPRLKVVPQPLDDLQAKAPLPGLREPLPQARVVGRRLAGDGLDDRHQLPAQLGKEGPQRRGFHAIVGLIDQRIGDVLIAGEIVGQLPTQVNGLDQVGLDGLEVVPGPGLGPHLVRLGAVVGQLGHKGRRDAHRPFVLAPRDPDQAGVVRVVGQALRVGPQIVQEPADGRSDELDVGQPLQGGHLPGAGLQRHRAACRLIWSHASTADALFRLSISMRRFFSSCSFSCTVPP